MFVDATPLIDDVRLWAVARRRYINMLKVIDTKSGSERQRCDICVIMCTPLIGDGGRGTEVQRRGVCCVGVVNTEIV